MKRFADSIAREKGVKPPPGYATSGSICRAFLDQHAPKKAGAAVGPNNPIAPSLEQSLITAISQHEFRRL